MKDLFFSGAFFFLFTCGPAAQPLVFNVKAEADEEKVAISYDLNRNGNHAFFNVCLVSLDPSIRPQNVTGAVGKNIHAGLNKKIIWYYAKEQLKPDQIAALRLDVRAFDPLDPQAGLPPRPKYVPAFAGLGGAVLLGGNILVVGLLKEIGARKDYDAYKADPADLEQYEKANSKHLKAQWMMAGGALVLTTAGIILIKRISFLRQWKRERSTGRPPVPDCAAAEPHWQFQPTLHAGGMAGIGFHYCF